MISDLSQREDELDGKTLLIVGLGRIGSRLASLARAFGMRTIATKRDASTGAGAADAAFPQDRLLELLPNADVVALTCPLTPETERLIGAQALAAMKPSAILVNVARGRVVDEPALVEALAGKRIAAAGLDCTVEEPLPADLAAVGARQCADHAAYRRRDPALRGQRHRPAVGKPGAHLAGRDAAAQSHRLIRRGRPRRRAQPCFSFLCTSASPVTHGSAERNQFCRRGTN